MLVQIYQLIIERKKYKIKRIGIREAAHFLHAGMVCNNDPLASAWSFVLKAQVSHRGSNAFHRQVITFHVVTDYTATGAAQHIQKAGESR